VAFLIAAAVVVIAMERMRRWRFRPAPFLRRGFGTDVAYLLTGHVATAGVALGWVAVGGALVGGLGVPRLTMSRWLAVPLAVVALDAGQLRRALASPPGRRPVGVPQDPSFEPDARLAGDVSARTWSSRRCAGSSRPSS
jgi:hypothetical protein